MPYAKSSLYKTFSGGSKLEKMTMAGGARLNAKDAFNLFNEKKEFLLYVFSNLIVQLGITYYVMMNYNAQNTLSMQLMLFMAQILIIFILAFIPMPAWLKFILFSIFSFTFGIFLSSLKKTVNINIIRTALVGTLGIFASMVIFGLGLILFGINLGYRFGMGLLCALMAFILVLIVFRLLGTYSYAMKILSLFGLFLFSLFIIYDTNTILQRNYYGDFITASLDYYLDILNIFVNLVNFDSR